MSIRDAAVLGVIAGLNIAAFLALALPTNLGTKVLGAVWLGCFLTFAGVVPLGSAVSPKKSD